MRLRKVSTTQEPKPAELERWGARLTRVRDIALVGFAAVYAFGYVARALHAWEHNLGVLPGVELQYFVAGALLLVPPALVVLALFGAWRLFKRVARWEADEPRRRDRVDKALGVAFIAGFVLLLLKDAGWFQRAAPDIGVRYEWLGVLLFMSSLFANIGLALARGEATVQRTSAKRGWFDRIGSVIAGLLVLNVGLLVAVLLLASMLLGAAKLLPVLPQALGGAAPRCAQFDVDRAALSPALAETMFAPPPVAPASAPARPARTRPVWVHHSGGDSVLFKLPGEASTSGATYELKRAAINAVLWCRDAQAMQP